MYGYNAVLAHPFLEAYARPRPGHILVQQLAQKLGRGHDLGQERLPGRNSSQSVSCTRASVRTSWRMPYANKL